MNGGKSNSSGRRSLEHDASDRRIVIDTKFTSILTDGWYRDETLRSGYLFSRDLGHLARALNPTNGSQRQASLSVQRIASNGHRRHPRMWVISAGRQANRPAVVEVTCPGEFPICNNPWTRCADGDATDASGGESLHQRHRRGVRTALHVITAPPFGPNVCPVT